MVEDISQFTKIEHPSLHSKATFSDMSFYNDPLTFVPLGLLLMLKMKSVGVHRPTSPCSKCPLPTPSQGSWPVLRLIIPTQAPWVWGLHTEETHCQGRLVSGRLLFSVVGWEGCSFREEHILGCAVKEQVPGHRLH